MPASEIQRWIPVLQELWLTAACKVLAEYTEVSFEVEDTQNTETSRPLGVCSEFEVRIGEDSSLGKILFGVPAASREISELALLGQEELDISTLEAEMRNQIERQAAAESVTADRYRALLQQRYRQIAAELKAGKQFEEGETP